MSKKQICYMSAGIFLWLMSLVGFIQNYVVMIHKMSDFKTFSIFILSAIFLSLMSSVLLDMIIFAFKHRRGGDV